RPGPVATNKVAITSLVTRVDEAANCSSDGSAQIRILALVINRASRMHTRSLACQLHPSLREDTARGRACPSFAAVLGGKRHGDLARHGISEGYTTRTDREFKSLTPRAYTNAHLIDPIRGRPPIEVSPEHGTIGG